MEIDPDSARTETARNIIDLIEEWWERFERKNAAYGDDSSQGGGLGIRALFPDFWRKARKLRRGFWEGDPIAYSDGESEEEIIEDAIGHLFLIWNGLREQRDVARVEEVTHRVMRSRERTVGSPVDIAVSDRERQLTREWATKTQDGVSWHEPADGFNKCPGTPQGFPCFYAANHEGDCVPDPNVVCTVCGHPSHGVGECISCEAANEPGRCSNRARHGGADFASWAEETMIPGHFMAPYIATSNDTGHFFINGKRIHHPLCVLGENHIKKCYSKNGDVLEIVTRFK